MSTVTANKIVHLHIPKTAGTALRWAFSKADGGKIRVSPHFQEAKFANLDPNDFDFFSGHFGYNTATRLGGEIITILRNPVDRFVSMYYFWRGLSEKGKETSHRTTLASKYSLREFAKIKDEPALIFALYNAMTWQIACGASVTHRGELRKQGKTDADVVKIALDNLSTFALVGIQENMDSFASQVESKYSVSLKMKAVNVTQKRPGVKEIDAETVALIREWCHMDFEVYDRVVKKLTAN